MYRVESDGETAYRFNSKNTKKSNIIIKELLDLILRQFKNFVLFIILLLLFIYSFLKPKT